MRTVTAKDRRALLVRRHHLAADAGGPEQVTRALIALHATDPASVYLSVLARSASSTLSDVSAALYERVTLIRWMAMRRTVFVLPFDDVPVVQAAVGNAVGAMLRRQLVNQLARAPQAPAGDPGRWLSTIEGEVETALEERGSATGAQLGAAVPALATLVPTAAAPQPQRMTTSLLTMMSACGRLVRAAPIGDWTNRQHTWALATRWWPDGVPVVDEVVAQRDLARRWLSRYGPATVEDLQWWTGWNKTITARAVAGLSVEEVDLHGRPGIALPDRIDTDGPVEPVAALLPALDPTPMGYRHRDWFLDVDPGAVFDRAGNIGPTVWWDGRIVGSWAVTSSGIRTALLTDCGADAASAVERVAARLDERLDGKVVVPAVRTPVERTLATQPSC